MPSIIVVDYVPGARTAHVSTEDKLASAFVFGEARGISRFPATDSTRHGGFLPSFKSYISAFPSTRVRVDGCALCVSCACNERCAAPGVTILLH